MIPSSSSNELIRVTVVIHLSKKLALLVSNDGDSDNGVWLPKSEIRDRVDLSTDMTSQSVELSIPQWLADTKGLSFAPIDAGVDDLFANTEANR